VVIRTKTLLLGLLGLGLALVPARGQDIGAVVESHRLVGLSGSISASMETYTASGIDGRKVPFSWTIAGEPALSVFGISLPFSLVISEQERSFRQPFNQFGVSPNYKWATAHLGYRSLTFSPFTLAGHSFYGAGLELNPGRFRFGAMYGRFQRPVPEDTLATNQDTTDRTPAFLRKGYSVKLGYGTNTNYVDLSWLRAWDDLNSIPCVPLKTDVLPGHNSALGFSIKQQFLRVLSWDMDLGLSHLTRDVRAAPIEPSNWALSFLTRTFGTRLSTAIYLGGQTGLSLQAGPFQARLGYRLVGPDYQTLGAYYAQSDVSALDFTSSLGVLSGKLGLTGTASLQTDNVGRANLLANQRLNWSAGISVSPAQLLGADLQYAEYATRQKPGTIPVPETTRVEQTTHSLTVSPRSSFSTGSLGHSLSASYSLQWVTDRNPLTADQSQSDSRMTTVGYQLSLVPQGLNLSTSVTSASVAAYQNTTSNVGFSLGASKGFINNALSVSLSPALAWTRSGDTLASMTLTSTLGAGYGFWTRHSLTSNLSYTGNFSRASSGKTFAELRGSAGYSVSF
jgi:hypothetical protein